MTSNRSHIETLGKAFLGLSKHSDGLIGRAAVRFHNLVQLMDSKSKTGIDPTMDAQNSGFPILPEVMRVSSDLRKGTLDTARRTDEVLKEMLNEMLVSKRLPNGQQIEDMALAKYAEKLSVLGRGESGADEVLGPTTVETFKRVSPREVESDTREVVYEWDYWPASDSRPAVTTARIEIESADPIATENWIKVEVMRAAHEYSGAGATLFELAAEIDKNQKMRLKELTKVTFTGIETPGFHTTSEELHALLSSVEDETKSWILTFEVEKLKSRGTQIKRRFIMPAVKYEDFYVNPHQKETIARRCSSFDRHAVMPSKSYGVVSGMKDFVKETMIHVVSDDGRTLNENL